jgi:hypothetical protein
MGPVWGPAESGQAFRANPDTESGRKRTGIPAESGQVLKAGPGH